MKGGRAVSQWNLFTQKVYKEGKAKNAKDGGRPQLLRTMVGAEEIAEVVSRATGIRGCPSHAAEIGHLGVGRARAAGIFPLRFCRQCIRKAGWQPIGHAFALRQLPAKLFRVIP